MRVASAGLVAKAAELGGREAAKALWGLAALRRVPDAALVTALSKVGAKERPAAYSASGASNGTGRTGA